MIRVHACAREISSSSKKIFMEINIKYYIFIKKKIKIKISLLLTHNAYG